MELRVPIQSQVFLVDEYDEEVDMSAMVMIPCELYEQMNSEVGSEEYKAGWWTYISVLDQLTLNECGVSVRHGSS